MRNVKNLWAILKNSYYLENANIDYNSIGVEMALNKYLK